MQGLGFTDLRVQDSEFVLSRAHNVTLHLKDCSIPLRCYYSLGVLEELTKRGYKKPIYGYV